MLQTNRKMLAFYLLLLFLLAACVPLSPPTPGESSGPTATPFPVAEPTTTDATGDCPVPSADSQLLRNEAAGYCLLLPASFEAKLLEETNGATVFAPATTAGHGERLFINIEDALGRSLEDVAAQVLIDNQIPGMEYELSPDAELGGGPAYVIGKMAGQNLNRRVIAVHDGRVYTLIFMPDDAEQQPANAEMETLYQAVMASFAFIPPTQPTGIPLPNGYPADALFSWEGRILGDGGAVAACQRMDISADGETRLGTCAELQTRLAETPVQWAEIRERFQPFHYTSGDFDLHFAGQGDIYDPVWSRALGRWAQMSYGEMASGRVGAANRTAVSWWLGEVEGKPGACKHLVVLDYGYAYANIDPCGGGDNISTRGGWLETPEMKRFDGLVYGFATAYQAENYFNGLGGQEMGAAEFEQIDQWAAQIFERLQP
ncbi:MAG: hypothetical protein KF753_12530 [Caldilineaceae bacterium]|nr:hypothetical protein [Caldilineaceae bacterium]